MRFIHKSLTKGFTLIEIIIVMALMAIVMALVIPRVGRGFENMKLRRRTRECSAVLRYTRSVAIGTQQEQRVSFILHGDPEKEDYYEYYKVTHKAIKQEEENYDYGEKPPAELNRTKHRGKLDPGMYLRWRTDQDSDWEAEGGYEIFFSPRGFNSGGEIRFAYYEDDRSYIVKLEPVTGRVKISKGED